MIVSERSGVTVQATIQIHFLAVLSWSLFLSPAYCWALECCTHAAHTLQAMPQQTKLTMIRHTPP